MFIRQVKRLKDVREWSIPTGDTLHRRLQTKEALWLDGGRDLGAKSIGQWRFVSDQSSSRFLHWLVIIEKNSMN